MARGAALIDGEPLFLSALFSGKAGRSWRGRPRLRYTGYGLDAAGEISVVPFHGCDIDMIC